MKKDAPLDVFEYALKMEADGEKLYRTLAARTADAGVKGIFNDLAGDEAKHAQVIRELAKGAVPEMAQTKILESAKNVFSGMDAKQAFQAAGDDQIALYRQALDVETKSRDFYKSQAGRAGEKGIRAIFERLADEESRHMSLVENMLEFISRPQTWLENAEFNHLEEY